MPGESSGFQKVLKVRVTKQVKQGHISFSNLSNLIVELALSSGPCRELFSGKPGNVEQQHLCCEHNQEAGEADFAAQERAGTSGHNRIPGTGPSVTNSEQIPVMISQSVSTGTGNAVEGEITNTDAAARNSSQCLDNPQGGNERNQDIGNNWSSSEATKSRSSSSCTSSSYNGSGSEDNDESHDVEDDWETAFDSLEIQSSVFQPETRSKGLSSERMQHSEAKEPHDKKSSGAEINQHPDCLQGAQLKPEYKYKTSGFGSRRSHGGRAWRPDDISRPPMLPRLTKQHTYPGHQNGGGNHGWGSTHGNMWGLPPAPTYCPICTEELDTTDSSYLPCSCGFQLCLFCYHRISSDDGHCPGCWKAYNSEVTVKLSRSSSLLIQCMAMSIIHIVFSAV